MITNACPSSCFDHESTPFIIFCKKMGLALNDQGLYDVTQENFFQHYMNVGYKGTGSESVNHVCLFNDAELTALLTLETFTDETQLPDALTKT